MSNSGVSSSLMALARRRHLQATPHFAAGGGTARRIGQTLAERAWCHASGAVGHPWFSGARCWPPGICVKMAPNVLPVLGEGGSGALLVLLGKLVGVGAEQVCSEFSPD
ncbi:MAG: hypothetical protein KHY40_12180 [Cutibacterium acnes]|uniref:hypothetical protein n=1 Tax=Cutibacterium sp. V947 TaxID=3446480 RepID=UPI003EE1FAC1|nr:hypothetical protein [Cutibacterium acnes]